jgi:hypothetical protein
MHACHVEPQSTVTSSPSTAAGRGGRRGGRDNFPHAGGLVAAGLDRNIQLVPIGQLAPKFSITFGGPF